MLNADIILQSSDLVTFRVHRSVLAASSPFFSDMFTLPQPPNECNELPVVHLSEDSVVLDSLISMLYPVPPEMPESSDDSLAVLAAAAKYDMDSIRSSIRAEVDRKELFSSTRAGLFRVYATAYRKRLIPETVMAARLTLDHPLTFESIGDALQSFEGCALRDLAEFRLRSIRKFLELLSDCMGPSNNLTFCPAGDSSEDETLPVPTIWFEDLQFQLMEVEKFAKAIPTHQKLFDEYLEALQNHVNGTDCQFCTNVHVMEGEVFRTRLMDASTAARNVLHPMQEE